MEGPEKKEPTPEEIEQMMEEQAYEEQMAWQAALDNLARENYDFERGDVLY